MESDNPALRTEFGAGGQIVRIFIENFMSSDHVEVHPGMHLNLIIGPNGSGKSTLQSAVLLGLGGKLSTLNRSSLNDFVKCGRDCSSIEIELYNPHGPNHVVRRVITTSNSSEFYLNDNKVRKSQIDELRHRYNIQVDNLCCFLSQEKVQDFSKMNNQQLLENTEMTVGEGELLTAHNELKGLRKDFVAHQNTLRKKTEELEKQTAKNERMKGRVDAIKEKQALCDEVATLNQKKHWLLYYEATKEVRDVEKDLKAAENVSETHEKKMQEERKKLQKIEENSQAQKNAYEVAKREEAGKKSVMDDRLSRLQQQLEQFNSLDAKLSQRDQEEADKKIVIRQTQTTIDKLTNDMAALGSVDQDSLAQAQRVTNELHNLRKKEESVSNERASIEEKMSNVKYELINVNRKKGILEGVRDRRLRELERQHPQVYQAVQWLERNRHLFKHKVFNPLILELDVTDKRMAAQVEAVIPQGDLQAFCVTYNDDLNLLVQKLRVEQKLKVNVVSAEDALNKSFPAPQPINDLKSIGFHAYIKDFITGPQEIIKFLCQNHGIHRIPVGDNRVNKNTDKVPPQLSRYFSADSQFMVKTSNYQNRAQSVAVNKLGPPRSFRENIDQNEIARLRQTEENLQRQLADQESQLGQLNTVQGRIQEKLIALRKEKGKLATLQDQKGDIKIRLDRAKQDLVRYKAALRDPKLIDQEFQREKQALEVKMNRMVDELRKAHEAYEAAYYKRLKSALLFKSCTIGIEDIKEAEQQAKDALRRAQETVNMIETKRQRAEHERVRAKNAARELTEGVSPDQKAFKEFEAKFKKLSNSIDVLDERIGEAKAKADFLDGGSAEILNEYNTREREIVELREKIEELQVTETTLLAELNTKREDWLMPVKRLIERVDETFGRHFDTMKCVGEISLAIPTDENNFDEYGVCIKVKFWDHMPLQELTRYTQSGGERTVATAIYGLSLQNLTNVPFRFVDEINQGMDARNERSICEMLTSATSRADSPQYFYLTPKLMDSFSCPESMAVLCVYNGPEAIKTTDWDVAMFIRRAKRVALEDDDGSD